MKHSRKIKGKKNGDALFPFLHRKKAHKHSLIVAGEGGATGFAALRIFRARRLPEWLVFVVDYQYAAPTELEHLHGGR